MKFAHRENKYGIDLRDERERKTSDGPFDEIDLSGMKLSDLDTIAILGVGGFGRVSLVRWAKDEQERKMIFALKACSKDFVRISQQEQHVNNERIVRKFLTQE